MIRLIFGIVLLFAGVPGVSQNLKFDRIEVEEVNRAISTFARVGCDGFEKSFGERLQRSLITDSAILSKFAVALRKVRYKRRQKEIDVRYKLYLQCGNECRSYIVCGDRFDNLLINGRSISTSAQLITLVRSCLRLPSL